MWFIVRASMQTLLGGLTDKENFLLSNGRAVKKQDREEKADLSGVVKPASTGESASQRGTHRSVISMQGWKAGPFVF